MTHKSSFRPRGLPANSLPAGSPEKVFDRTQTTFVPTAVKDVIVFRGESAYFYPKGEPAASPPPRLAEQAPAHLWKWSKMMVFTC